MMARLLIPVIVLTVLPYLWIDRQYLHIPKGKNQKSTIFDFRLPS